MKIKKYKALFIIFTFFIVIYFLLDLIKIKKIECKTQYGECPKSIYGDSKNIKDIKKSLKSNFLVNNFTIQYQIPSILKVFVNIKKAEFIVYDQLANKYFSVDKDGLILNNENDSTLSLLTKKDFKGEIGTRISDKDLFFLNLIRKVNLLYGVNVGEYFSDGDYLSIKLKSGETVYFPSVGDVDVLIGGLRVIFSRLNDNDEGIKMDYVKEIDLRFKNPVLR